MLHLLRCQLSVLLFAFLVISIPDSRAQEDQFKTGYIVHISGDTTRGYIKQLVPEAHSTYLLFKSSKSDNQTKYYPEDLSSYYFDPAYYYIADSVIFSGYNNNLYQDRLFLRQLVDGDIELFRLDHVLKTSVTPLIEYESQFYFFRIKGTKLLIDLQRNNYFQKLKAAFKSRNCNLPKNQTFRFSDDGLSNLIMAYNECLGEKARKTYLNIPSKKLVINYGFSFGLARTLLNPEHPAFNEFTMVPQIGYDLNLFINPQINRWLQLRLSINYKNRVQNFSQEYTVSEFYVNSGERFELMGNVTINQISIPLHLLLTVPYNKYRIYLLTGGFFGKSINNSAYLDEVYFVSDINGSLIVDQRINPFKDRINPLEYGYTFGLGTFYLLNEHQSIFMEIQYSKSRNNAIVDFKEIINQEAFVFLLGYSF